MSTIPLEVFEAALQHQKDLADLTSRGELIETCPDCHTPLEYRGIVPYCPNPRCDQQDIMVCC